MLFTLFWFRFLGKVLDDGQLVHTVWWSEVCDDEKLNEKRRISRQKILLVARVQVSELPKMMEIILNLKRNNSSECYLQLLHWKWDTALITHHSFEMKYFLINPLLNLLLFFIKFSSAMVKMLVFNLEKVKMGEQFLHSNCQWCVFSAKRRSLVRILFPPRENVALEVKKFVLFPKRKFEIYETIIYLKDIAKILNSFEQLRKNLKTSLRRILIPDKPECMRTNLLQIWKKIKKFI